MVLKKSSMHRVFAFLLALLAVQPAWADWRVDAESSRVSFIVSKDAQQTDVGRFFGLLGDVDPAGHVRLQIEIDSLRTGSLLQDQRLRKELFASRRFPYAEVHARLELQPISKLAPGAQMELSVPATLTLLGKEKVLNTELLITRLDDHRFQVVTLSPVVLDVTDFGLGPVVDSLRRSVGLQSVSQAVPVTAVLILTER